MADFSHLSDHGTAAMVDVGAKEPSSRQAIAMGEVKLPEGIVPLLSDILVREIASVARIAGIQAMKQTANLIPMCHQLSLESAKVSIELERTTGRFVFHVEATIQGKTGVEMECLVGVSIVGATIYDMIKARAPDAVLGPYRVVTKLGGKDGKWENPTMTT